MTSWKGRLTDALGCALGVHIVRKGFVHGLLEIDYLERVFDEFKIDCVFDIGANAGQYAERIRRIGFSGPIISFEPIPRLANMLRQKAMRDPLWFVEQVALDDAVHTASFNVTASDECSSLLMPDASETDRVATLTRVAEKIEVTTGLLETYFDRYAAKLGFSRPFLKMDAQGCDLAIARGAGPRLGKFVALQSELAFKRLYKDQPTWREAIDFYEASGFELTALVPNNEGHFPVLIELDCIMFQGRAPVSST